MPCLLGVLQIPLFALFNALGHAAVEHLGLAIPGNLAAATLLFTVVLGLYATGTVSQRLAERGRPCSTD
jgi:putative effector of murein hydrolase LrgA (UPF0299 family)